MWFEDTEFVNIRFTGLRLLSPPIMFPHMTRLLHSSYQKGARHLQTSTRSPMLRCVHSLHSTFVSLTRDSTLNQPSNPVLHCRATSPSHIQTELTRLGRLGWVQNKMDWEPSEEPKLPPRSAPKSPPNSKGAKLLTALVECRELLLTQHSR